MVRKLSSIVLDELKWEYYSDHSLPHIVRGDYISYRCFKHDIVDEVEYILSLNEDSKEIHIEDVTGSTLFRGQLKSLNHKLELQTIMKQLNII